MLTAIERIHLRHSASAAVHVPTRERPADPSGDEARLRRALKANAQPYYIVSNHIMSYSGPIICPGGNTHCLLLLDRRAGRHCGHQKLSQQQTARHQRLSLRRMATKRHPHCLLLPQRTDVQIVGSMMTPHWTSVSNLNLSETGSRATRSTLSGIAMALSTHEGARTRVQVRRFSVPITRLQ